MNQVLILSDSHGLKKELLEIKKRHQNALFVHCGDSELSFDSKELEGFIKVGGNCDLIQNFLTNKFLTSQV